MESICLTQKQMEVLFDGKHATVSEYIKNNLALGELNKTFIVVFKKSSGEENKKGFRKIKSV